MSLNKFVFQCTYCDTKSSFEFLHIKGFEDMAYVMRKCDSCERVVFFIYERIKRITSKLSTKTTTPRPTVYMPERNYEDILRIEYELVDYYPKRSYKPHEAITKEVADDYVEALRCFDNNAFKGCVAMARRSIQTTCLLKGATKGKDLKDQIEEIIPPDLKALAHEIRLWGNLGAHSDVLIKDVIDKDAKEILDFAEMLFRYLFIMPYEVKQKQIERKGSKP